MCLTLDVFRPGKASPPVEDASSRPNTAVSSASAPATSATRKRRSPPAHEGLEERESKVHVGMRHQQEQASHGQQYSISRTSTSINWPLLPSRADHRQTPSGPVYTSEPGQIHYTHQRQPSAPDMGRYGRQSEFQRHYAHLLEPPVLPNNGSKGAQVSASHPQISRRRESYPSGDEHMAFRRSSDPVGDRRSPEYRQYPHPSNNSELSNPASSTFSAPTNEEVVLPKPHSPASRSQSPSTLEHGRTLLSLSSILNPANDNPAPEPRGSSSVRLPGIQDLMNGASARNQFEATQWYNNRPMSS